MKKNLLVTRGTVNKITPSLVEKLKKTCSTSECYTVIGYDDQLELYDGGSYCIKRTDCLNVDYDSYYDSLEIKRMPIDVCDLTGFQSFLSPAMLMQRRFEERSMLNYSRSLSSHYEKIIKHFVFWHSFLEQKNIKVVVFSDAPHEVYDYIIYELCKRKNIHTYIYRNVHKTDRYIVMEDLSDAKKDCLYHYKALEGKETVTDGVRLDSDLECLYSSLVSRKNQDLFYTDTCRAMEFKYRFGQTRVAPFIKESINRSKENSISIMNVSKYIDNFFFIQRKKRETRLLIRNYEKKSITPCFSDPYVYLALHLLPESAAEPLGGIYSEQFWVAYLISCFMPTGWKLYIKLHPAQVGTVITADYIDLLKSIPNVEMISLKSNQQELINHAKAVATLTGEIALEAMFVNVPCLIFGYSYYEALPNSFPIRTKEDMKRTFDVIQNYPPNITDEIRRLYFTALQEASYKGTEATIDEICERIRREEGNE